MLSASITQASVDYGYRIPKKCYFCQDHDEYAHEINDRLVYEGKFIRVILDRAPSVEGHILITPKRHADKFEDLTAQEWLEIRPTLQKVIQLFKLAYKIDDCLVMQRNGIGAGQQVFHYHIHVYPANRPSNEDILQEIVIRKPMVDSEILKKRAKNLSKIWNDNILK